MQKTSNFARRLCNLPVTEGMVQEMRQVFVDNPLMQAALMDPTVSQQEKDCFHRNFAFFLRIWHSREVSVTSVPSVMSFSGSEMREIRSSKLH